MLDLVLPSIGVFDGQAKELVVPDR